MPPCGIKNINEKKQKKSGAEADIGNKCTR